MCHSSNKSLESFWNYSSKKKKKKCLMETSMVFLYQLLPFTFNVRKNECFVCKLLIGFLRKFNRLISQIK